MFQLSQGNLKHKTESIIKICFSIDWLAVLIKKIKTRITTPISKHSFEQRCTFSV